MLISPETQTATFELIEKNDVQTRIRMTLKTNILASIKNEPYHIEGMETED
jgi:hypothetical protein